jgi:hypothetical protein
MENRARNYLTIFLIGNSDNSDITKKWELGVRYHNNNWCDWRICYPREVSCRPLRLELYFTGDKLDEDSQVERVRLYPSCYFINMPNKYKTVKPGETYEHIIDITPWRDFLTHWEPSEDREREKGTFSLAVIYPHVHHYSIGYLTWKGLY